MDFTKVWSVSSIDHLGNAKCYDHSFEPFSENSRRLTQDSLSNRFEQVRIYTHFGYCAFCGFNFKEVKHENSDSL